MSAQQVAQTIRQQIGAMNLAAVGAHEFSYTREGHGGLQFKMGGRQRWAHIVLNGRDLYDVELFRLDRHYNRVTIYAVDNIYAEDLGRVIRDNAYRDQRSGQGHNRGKGLRARAAARRRR